MKKFLYDIKVEASQLKERTDEELSCKVLENKKQLREKETDDQIAKWFAITQEIAYRTIGFRHFETQLSAGLFLHRGKIVEMKTGEGKTLCSTLPVSLNAVSGKGVHVVTVNDYLAERDQKWMGKVYQGLGLDVGLVKSTSSLSEKRKSYQKSITYVTNSELVFDYLRDSSAYYPNEMVQRPFHYCVLDEIDSILIDEARTPLIISTNQGAINGNKLYLANQIIDDLEKEKDFQIDEKRKDINLTELGYQKTKEKLGKRTLYEVDDPWILEILNALKAKYIFKLNKDYIVLNNKIVIVDEFTGRIMEDRRWSMGIHEAVEVKENVVLGSGTKTKSSITYQNFFTLYPKLAGMTGTAKTTEKEFQDIYNLDVIVVETAKPMIRKDLSDLVYQSELKKWKAVLSQSKDCFKKGQPILIGTASVEKSELLSELFKLSRIPHQVLNAKPENVFRESEIVAQAGKRFAVTIATNMAGRGTDIILGGNPNFQMKQIFTGLFLEPEEFDFSLLTKEFPSLDWKEKKEDISLDYSQLGKPNVLRQDIENLPYSLEQTPKSFQVLYQYIYDNLFEQWKQENIQVKELGGLFVLGTERSETRRIDNQLRGRAGRQGDPGVSQFCVSLEDDLMKVFGGESIRKWVEYLMSDEDLPLESDMLTKSLENAQKKLELYNYDIRKNVFQYDNILNSQRKQLFQARKRILCEINSSNLFLCYLESNWEKIEPAEGRVNFFPDFYDEKELPTLYEELWLQRELRFNEWNSYEKGFFSNSQTWKFLTIFDFYWTEHLERMSSIRETINWRSYGQQNPLTEYNLEAFQSFQEMIEEMRSCMIYYFLDHPILQ